MNLKQLYASISILYDMYSKPIDDTLFDCIHYLSHSMFCGSFALVFYHLQPSSPTCSPSKLTPRKRKAEQVWHSHALFLLFFNQVKPKPNTIHYWSLWQWEKTPAGSPSQSKHYKNCMFFVRKNWYDKKLGWTKFENISTRV